MNFYKPVGGVVGGGGGGSVGNGPKSHWVIVPNGIEWLIVGSKSAILMENL